VYPVSNEGFKALYGPHWWHFVGPALREVILPEDDYKISVNGELVWDTLGALAYSEDITFGHLTMIRHR